jgi:PIN domain nuclease of toxin-antitoxin system
VKILLDTHLLLWWLGGGSRLPQTARRLVADPENTVFVSAVSLWEIWLKRSLGKLQLPDNFEEVLAAESFESLPLTCEQAREVARLPWLHRDPFDRMLVAQARVSRLRLLTADEIVASYGDPVLLAK